MFSMDQDRMNQDLIFDRIVNNEIQLCKKTYKWHNKTVVLLPLKHEALPSFYAQMEKEMAGKVVLVEGTGENIEDLQKVVARLQESGNFAHLERFEIIGKGPGSIPNCLGMVTQTVLSYENCKKSIHADKVNPNNLTAFFASAPIDIIKQKIDDNAMQIIDSHRQGFCIKNCQINDVLKETMSRLACERNKNENPHLLARLHIDAFCNINTWTAAFLTGKSSTLDPNANKYFYEKVIQRNPFVFEKLGQELTSGSDEIYIAYGKAHMPFIAEFLIELGFKQEADVKWFVAMRL